MTLNGTAAGVENQIRDELLLSCAGCTSRGTAVDQNTEASEQLDVRTGRSSHGSSLHAIAKGTQHSDRGNRWTRCLAALPSPHLAQGSIGGRTILRSLNTGKWTAAASIVHHLNATDLDASEAGTITLRGGA
jgi:hypothetical protein